MVLLIDVIIGYFIPDTFGWLFFAFVIIIETYLLRILLKKKGVEFQNIIYWVIFANLITTIIGFFIGESHLGHLINIVPVDYYRGDYMFDRALGIFIASFVATMIFETFIFFMGLRKKNLNLSQIIKKSFIINTTSYFIGLIIIVIYFYYKMNK